MKHRSPRRFLAVVAAATAASALVGCSTGGSSATEHGAGEGPVPEPTAPVTISFASWVGEQPEMKKLVQQFQTEHPNIKIELQNVPAEEANEKLTAQVAGGNPPDVAFIDASTTANFASRKALVNLDNYLRRSEIVKADAYVPAFKTFTTYEDSMYGLPFDGESTALFYRTDLFAAAGLTGPPTTWEQYEAAAKALTDPAKRTYGHAMFASSPEAAYYWYPWLWQNGGKLLSDDGKEVLFNKDEGKRAAEYYVNLAKYAPKDYLNSNSYDGRQAFANGQVGMYVAGSWFAGTLADEFPAIDGKWATAPLPQGSAGCGTTIAGDALVIFSQSKQTDAAWKFIEFLSKPDNVAQWTYKSEDGTTLPPITSLLDSPDLVKTKPVLEGFAAAMKCGVSNVFANPDWPKIEEALNEQLAKAIYGEQTAAQALDAAAAEAEKIIR
ncbi:ABC transporter substrate-binding protein [Plantactinospora sp. KLBMP9567]|uniref:ABC transporter substrate-binding protein n=1 Tax=Plantactinospora sp. KLBMP9567 TaxID=3085900 RepID=UPI002981F6AC|nr:ABC transporter substrate-binding protein [Plantactinospora sp. KLBMP9567]MDW5327984.1 ABC transporter substrate-binding protein [Plantactinospora sp. KLBMP9567]